MKNNGGSPPRYDNAGLTSGCFSSPFGAYSWSCSAIVIRSPSGVIRETDWSERDPDGGSEAVDPMWMGPLVLRREWERIDGGRGAPGGAAEAFGASSPLPERLLRECSACRRLSRKRSRTRTVMSSEGGGHNALGLCNESPVEGMTSYYSRVRTMSRYKRGAVAIMLTLSVLLKMLGKECVKSHQGEMSTPPAGAGRSASRMTCRSARESPPPAESPAMTMRPGLTGLCAAPSGGRMRKRSTGTSDRWHRYSYCSSLHAASRSWIAQGKGYCGASR